MGIEEGLGVASHLVVEDAALAAFAYLLDEIGDEDGLSGAGGAGDDGVPGLGAVGPGDAGDAVGRFARRPEPPREARARRDAASELLRRDQFAAAQAPPALEPAAGAVERGESSDTWTAVFFLMTPLVPQQPSGAETASTVRVDPEDAKVLVLRSETDAGRACDRAVTATI